ncbi:MAG TPA: hypothetical protein DIC56_01515 [Rhizobium sp.]|nr:hypothetical protein [Rhizobium sp.]
MRKAGLAVKTDCHGRAGEQRRLRESIRFAKKVATRFGSALIAYGWYRSQSWLGVSGQAAMQLVGSERADEVLDCIDV